MSITTHSIENFLPKKTVFQNEFFDWAFIIFPIWIGISYLCLIQIYPNHRPFLFFLYLFIFGESHFGVTWLFFKNEGSTKWFIRNSFVLVFTPLFLIILFIIYAFHNLDAAIFILMGVSTFHVTRQSVGIFKIYENNPINLDEYLIYSSTIFWSLLGFTRFLALPFLKNSSYIEYFNILNMAIVPIGILGLIITGVVLLIRGLKFNNALQTASLATGMLMFAPIVFVEYPQDATIIGVGMHWCQYLALNFKLYFLKDGTLNTNGALLNHPYFHILCILLYSIFMAGIITDFGSEFSNRNNLILIPLCFELYHFYLDAFIWRFSDIYIRNSIGKNLFAKN